VIVESMERRSNNESTKEEREDVVRRAVLVLKGIGKLVLIALVCLVVMHTGLLLFWGWQLDRTLAAIQSRGEPISVAQTVPRRIPDSQNAAVIYEQAVRVYQKLWPSDQKTLLAMDQFLNAETPDARSKLEPSARSAIKLFSAVFPLIDKAQSRRMCVFSLSAPSQELDWLYSRSGFPALHELSELLQVKAILEASDGKTDQAIDDLIRNLKLGEADAGNPRSAIGGAFSIGRYVGTSIEAASQITETHRFTASQARRFYEELTKIDLDPIFVQGQKGDRAQLCSMFDAARGDLTYYLFETSWGIPSLRIAPFSRTVLAPTDAPPPMPGKLVHFSDSIVSYLWRPFSYKDELCYVHLYSDSLRVSRLPYREARQLGVPTPLYARITRLPSYRPFLGAWRLRDMGKAYIGLGQVAMALQAYRSRFGQYPSSLAELKSTPGWKLPDDPFSGKPFVYKPHGNGFTIYSIGMDLKDDGGRQMGSGRQPKGDIVEMWGS
jgi:hypothetical protein